MLQLPQDVVRTHFAWRQPDQLDAQGALWYYAETIENPVLKEFITNILSDAKIMHPFYIARASQDYLTTTVLKTSAVYKYRFDGSENKKVFLSEIKRVSCPVKAGSIIISRMNAPELVGASGYVEEDAPNLYLPDRLWQARFKSDDKMIAKFTSKSLITRGFRGVIESIATGSSPSMKNISKGDLLNIHIALPPKGELSVIFNELVKQEDAIDEAISIQNQQIERLKEYKTTLINSAVTGKIKITPEMLQA